MSWYEGAPSLFRRLQLPRPRARRNSALERRTRNRKVTRSKFAGEAARIARDEGKKCRSDAPARSRPGIPGRDRSGRGAGGSRTRTPRCWSRLVRARARGSLSFRLRCRRGGEPAASAEEVFARAELIVKVKEPQAAERARLRPDQVLFTYLHLAADLAQTQGLMASRCHGDRLRDGDGPEGWPAAARADVGSGRASWRRRSGLGRCRRRPAGAECCSAACQGWRRGRVAMIGGGVVGSNAARIARGHGRQVTVLDAQARIRSSTTRSAGWWKRATRRRGDDRGAGGRSADLVIGAVLIPGAAARSW